MLLLAQSGTLVQRCRGVWLGSYAKIKHPCARGQGGEQAQPKQGTLSRLEPTAPKGEFLDFAAGFGPGDEVQDRFQAFRFRRQVAHATRREVGEEEATGFQLAPRLTLQRRCQESRLPGPLLVPGKPAPNKGFL